MRNDGGIGKSLEAEVSLYCGAELKSVLDKLGDELRFVLITSSAEVNGEVDEEINGLEQSSDASETANPNLKLAITKSTFTKCVRCWHHRSDVGAYSEHPELCGRCVDNVEGEGEAREFA
jgi:isoleucyl-tRNA synthetase